MLLYLVLLQSLQKTGKKAPVLVRESDIHAPMLGRDELPNLLMSRGFKVSIRSYSTRRPTP